MYLYSPSKSVAGEREQEKEFSDADVAPDVKDGVSFGLVGALTGLGGNRRLVLVHEHCDAENNEKDEEVFEEWIFFAPEQDAQ